METITLLTTAEDAGQRLDSFLAGHIDGPVRRRRGFWQTGR